MRREVFGGFLDLANADDQDILNYARQWGVLGLCQHGLPIAHEITPVQGQFAPLLEAQACEGKQQDGWYYEPLDKWRYYASQMAAMVRLAVDLRNDRITEEEIQEFKNPRRVKVKRYESTEYYPYWDPLFEVHPLDRKRSKKAISTKAEVMVSPRIPGKREDWETVFQDFEGPYQVILPVGVWTGRIALSTAINRWLGLTGIRPYFSWAGNETKFILGSSIHAHSLLPIFAVQLMLLVNGSPDYAVCYSCHKPFFLRKGQNTSQRSYCKECGLKAARREAVKKYYHEQRQNPSRMKRKRLTPNQVQAIQKALKKPKPGLVKQLAAKYGVSAWAIYKIREGKTWKESE
jgi:hypothetical protein